MTDTPARAIAPGPRATAAAADRAARPKLIAAVRKADKAFRSANHARNLAIIARSRAFRDALAAGLSASTVGRAVPRGGVPLSKRQVQRIASYTDKTKWEDRP